MEFKIEGEHIELVSLLKRLGLAESGGQAGQMVKDGMIVRNGEIETRKRAKIIPGDVIEYKRQKVTLV